jgi:zinc and cadmium transporter
VAALAHEIPQELGDYGVLVGGGWSRAVALRANVASAATFLVGGVLSWALSSRLDVDFLLPLGAGNFLYIAASDLVPEIKHSPRGLEAVVRFAAFLAGLLLLFGIRLIFHEMAGGGAS